jgi:hypothetical protein
MDIETPMRGKRLMIREMVLENFKSYAGIQRVGPFHKVYQFYMDVSLVDQELTCRTCVFLRSLFLQW